MLDILKDISTSAWVSMGGGAVSVLSLIFNWLRSKAAADSNVISSTNAWAQALMKYIEKEIEFALEDQKYLKQIFQSQHSNAADKRRILDRLNEIRSESGRNLAFLDALTGKANALIESRARLSKVYDSFMESGDLVATDEARAIVSKYNDEFRTYLVSIRMFAISLATERGSFLSSGRLESRSHSAH